MHCASMAVRSLFPQRRHGWVQQMQWLRLCIRFRMKFNEQRIHADPVPTHSTQCFCAKVAAAGEIHVFCASRLCDELLTTVDLGVGAAVHTTLWQCRCFWTCCCIHAQSLTAMQYFSEIALMHAKALPGNNNCFIRAPC